MESSKVCGKCKQEKPRSEFHKGRGKDGLRSWCKACVAEYNRQHYQDNIEHHREYQREWQATDRRRLRNQQNWFKRKYGLTLEERQAMVDEQEGRCYLCKKECELHVDHDAERCIVRKMLCGSCNRGIGQLGHDPELLRRAADYLEAFM